MSGLHERVAWDAQDESLPPPAGVGMTSGQAAALEAPRLGNRLRAFARAALRGFAQPTVAKPMTATTSPLPLASTGGSGTSTSTSQNQLAQSVDPTAIQDLLDKFPGSVERDIDLRRDRGESVTLLFAGPEGPDLYDLYRLPSEKADPELHRTLAAASALLYEQWKREWGITDDDIRPFRSAEDQPAASKPANHADAD